VVARVPSRRPPAALRPALAAAVFFAALLAAMGLAACGGTAPVVYRDAEHGVTFSYPAETFATGELSTIDLIAAAHRAAGVTPLKVVQVTATGGTAGTSGAGAGSAGLLVAVYERPDVLRSAGLWRTGDAMMGSGLPEARRAVAPAATIGDPHKTRFEGMEAYWATFAVDTADGAVHGFALVADGEDYVYEVILQLPAGSGEEALPALGRVFLSLRLS
jgi:hypothetical protein